MLNTELNLIALTAVPVLGAICAAVCFWFAYKIARGEK